MPVLPDLEAEEGGEEGDRALRNIKREEDQEDINI